MAASQFDWSPQSVGRLYNRTVRTARVTVDQLCTLCIPVQLYDSVYSVLRVTTGSYAPLRFCPPPPTSIQPLLSKAAAKGGGAGSAGANGRRAQAEHNTTPPAPDTRLRTARRRPISDVLPCNESGFSASPSPHRTRCFPHAIAFASGWIWHLALPCGTFRRLCFDFAVASKATTRRGSRSQSIQGWGACLAPCLCRA